MVDWLERARREIAQGTGQGTAKAAERNLTAVTAVPDPVDTENSHGSFGSNGRTTSVLILETAGVADDDRRSCDQCTNLTDRGVCLAARSGGIVASRNYEPIRDLLRRCEGYVPGAADPDRRSGRERWPELTDMKGMQ